MLNSATPINMVDFEGCGKCKLNGACKAYNQQVVVTFNKGQTVGKYKLHKKSFHKGDMVKMSAIVKNKKVYCIATSYGFLQLKGIKVTSL